MINAFLRHISRDRDRAWAETWDRLPYSRLHEGGSPVYRLYAQVYGRIWDQIRRPSGRHLLRRPR